MKTKSEDSELERELPAGISSYLSSRVARMRPPPPRSRNLSTDHYAPPEDYRNLIHISTARIACFDFDSPISTSMQREHFSQFLYRVQSRCVEASLTFALGASRATVDDIIGLSLAELLPRSFGYDALFEKWRDQQLSGQSFEIEVLDRDSSRLVLQSVVYANINTDGFSRMWVVLRDVTVHARAVQALARAELHYRSLVERPGQLLARIRPDGTHEYVSPYIEELFGLTPREFMRGVDPVMERIHPDDVSRLTRIRQARKDAYREPVEGEVRLKVKTGEYHWFFVRQFPKLGPQGEIEFFDVLVLDVQRHKNLEEATAQIEALGPNAKVAAGLAHDLNNHLTALIGQLDAALRAANDNAAVREPLLVARSAALAATHMAKRIGTSARGPQTKTEVAVSTLISEAAALVRHLLPTTISLHTTETSPDLVVAVDPTQMQQILLNLLLNARDSMPNGGKISISARACVEDDARPSAGERHVRIDVTDTGTGIPEHLQERIFEPFFTTKSEGRGSGLGLAMVREIATTYKGRVDLKSTEGSGSAFTVYLPLVDRPIPSKSPHQRVEDLLSPYPVVFDRETSMVIVDDDDLVRGMLVSALSKLGVAVVGVSDAASVLKLAHNSTFPHRVVLLDDSMPHTRGLELAPELHRLWPDAHIILTSGDSRTKEAAAKTLPGVIFLEKPFTLIELLDLVGTLLAGDSSRTA